MENRMAKKQYDLVVVDPPWPMERIPRAEYPDEKKTLDYDTLTLAEIMSLDCAPAGSAAAVFP